MGKLFPIGRMLAGIASFDFSFFGVGFPDSDVEFFVRDVCFLGPSLGWTMMTPESSGDRVVSKWMFDSRRRFIAGANPTTLFDLGFPCLRFGPPTLTTSLPERKK